MTDYPEHIVTKGDVLTQAVAYVLQGQGRAAADLLEKHFPTARDMFVAVYGLAYTVAATAPGDGGVVEVKLTKTEPPSGVTSRPHDDDVASLTAAMIGAAGNGDCEGACRAFFASEASVAGATVVTLLNMCAAVVKADSG
jgi:hypothetical protein